MPKVYWQKQLRSTPTCISKRFSLVLVRQGRGNIRGRKKGYRGISGYAEQRGTAAFGDGLVYALGCGAAVTIRLVPGVALFFARRRAVSLLLHAI